eukprot:SAG25_NODE_281_length_10457_cov_12.574339_6_plen_87_part_00
MLRILLDHDTALASFPTREGVTALNLAISSATALAPTKAIVAMLLDAGAQLDGYPTLHPNTYIHAPWVLEAVSRPCRSVCAQSHVR